MKGLFQISTRFPRFWYALQKTWCILSGGKFPIRTQVNSLLLPGCYLATDLVADLLLGLGVPWLRWLLVAVAWILTVFLFLWIRRSLHRDDSEKKQFVLYPVGCFVVGYLVFFPITEWVHSLLDPTYAFDWELVLSVSGFLLRIFVIVFLAVFIRQFLRQFESNGT